MLQNISKEKLSAKEKVGGGFPTGVAKLHPSKFVPPGKVVSKKK